MPAKKQPSPRAAKEPSLVGVDAVVAALREKATQKTLEGMARFGIPSRHALGVSMADMQKVAKRAGRNHALAAALWETGIYEARVLTSFVDEPELVTGEQMDRWTAAFDNWAVCDTLCFHLFNRSPHALDEAKKWARSEEEFTKRAAFALLACVALRGVEAHPDKVFLAFLPLVEEAATDERNFVKKGVLWGLRGVGARNATLKMAAVDLANVLAAKPDASSRWIGKTALREFKKA